MDNAGQQPPTTPQPSTQATPPIQPPQQPSSSKRKLLMSIGVIVLLLLVGGGAYYLGTQRADNQIASTQELSPSQVVPPETHDSTTTDTDSISTWEDYTSDTLKVAFKLPPSFSKFGQFKEEVRASESPFHGKIFCASFANSEPLINATCNINGFGFGTLSDDYDVGRGGVFSDLNGFIAKNGRYYLPHSSEPLPEKDVVYMKNQHGVEIIILNSHYIQTNEEGMPPIYHFSDNSVGALVNNKNSLSSGFAVKMELVNGLTEDDFRKTLDSIKPL